MTPIQASEISNENLVNSIFQDKRKTLNSKFNLRQLVLTADIKKVFSKGDCTNYSYKLYKIAETFHETITSLGIDYLPERYNENLLLPNKLTNDENNKFMKNIN